jgi:hypothetical protein
MGRFDVFWIEKAAVVFVLTGEVNGVTLLTGVFYMFEMGGDYVLFEGNIMVLGTLEPIMKLIRA